MQDPRDGGNRPGAWTNLDERSDMSQATCAVIGCESPAREVNYCWSHWARWSATGDPLSSRRRFDGASLRARIMRYVVEDASTGCWLWVGSLTHDGYGIISIPPNTSIGAHRAVYQEFRGEIDAASLDHLCRVRNCVNPDHLEPVSMRVNTRRGNTKAAAYIAREKCDQGHEFTPENTYLRTDGGRRCRACKNQAGRAAYAARKRAS